MDDTAFEGIVGRALQGVQRTGLVKMQISQPEIREEFLGDGGTIAGFPTKHYRLTERYTLTVGALGFHADPMRQTVVLDYWATSALALLRNPLLEMLATAETALAQADPTFADQAAAARQRLVHGSPLRIVARVRTEGDHPSESTRIIEVTHLERATFEASRFRVPEGYRLRNGAFSFSF